MFSTAQQTCFILRLFVCFPFSFHVGSGVGEAKAFAYAVKQAYDAWQIATELGFRMTLLDIGGGFPGQSNAPITFTEVSC